MAFAISKEKIPSFSEPQKVGFSHEDSESGSSVISSQLYLKSSHQTMDKNVVRRRIRHHKCLQKVRANLQALLDTSSTKNYDYEHKWLEQGDVFCSP
ncbi:hypothetical protein RND71_011488 [Anisodus tanguticus]|uniref:Uncharacterized protein n=1 Tax=Anisodus tanguticus TaxID=243964 RepID=A0AAE1SDH6_9SOLA|nr:hypothetical protein RND71_011488 [Anisodus tanguticus]